MRARGADSNPANRFERLHLEVDPDHCAPSPDDEEAPDPRTRLYVDPSRTIIATNQSPDVGFDASVNPYRGCEHGCSYCLAPETPVLHADFVWRPLGDVRVGDRLVGFEEHPAPGAPRELREAVVERVWWSRQPTMRVVAGEGEVVTTAEHRWLVPAGSWRSTSRLEVGAPLTRLAGAPRELGIGGVAFAKPAPIEAIEPGPMRDVVDIQTSTRTFYAAGLATHNCYARPTHEYLGFSAGLDFETHILVKERAPELLRRELSRPGWKPQVLALSGVTDAYQPAERQLGLTRRVLRVLADFRNPVAVITKSMLVARDADLLAELASFGAASVALSVTTLDPELQHRLEPRASRPGKRLAAIEALAKAGVPVGVMVAPIIPGLTDHEMPAILEAAANAGARFAGRVMLRLPHGLGDLFERWLDAHFPERKAKVLGRVREIRGGKLYDSRWGARQRGEGLYAEQLNALFQLSLKRLGMTTRGPALSTAHFRRPGEGQLALF